MYIVLKWVHVSQFIKYVHNNPMTHFHMLSIPEAFFKEEPSNLVYLEHLTY